MTGRATTRRLLPEWRRLLPLLTALVVVAAFSNSFFGVFVLDDHIRITDSPNVRQLADSILLSSRPLADLTLYLNYLLGSDVPADYHAFNLLIHLGAALFLFGIVRRTFQLATVPARFRSAAPVLAAFAAAIWAVHPLQTESVTYVVQRSECMMGFFYLLTLYSVIRGSVAGRDHAWYTAAIVGCALGMASKPVMVTAPLVVLLYDRAFVAGTFKSALRARRGLYTGLAATWLILVCLLSVPHESSRSAGPGAGLISPLGYLAAQQGVIVHYIKLVFWPHALCLDYGWPPAVTWPEVLVPGAGVLALVAATLYLGIRRNPLGFCSAWFLIILAPSSSIVPVADYAVEHRLYLPLAGAAVLVVAGLWGVAGIVGRDRLRRGAAGAAVLVILATVALLLAGKTRERNRTYASVEAMMRDTVSKRPANLRAQTALISELMRQRRYEEAEQAARVLLGKVEAGKRSGEARYGVFASDVAHYLPVAYNLVGRALLCRGRNVEAVVCFREAVRTGPRYRTAHHNLAVALYAQGQTDEAMHEAAAAISVAPEHGNSYAFLAFIQAKQRNYGDSLRNYRRGVRLSPRRLLPKIELGWLLAGCPEAELRDGEAALCLAKEVAAAIGSESFRVLDLMAAAHAENGNYGAAVRLAEGALRLTREQEASSDRPMNVELVAWDTGAELVPSDSEAIQQRLRLYRAESPFRL